MRLSGLAAGIATFAVLGITNNILRYYEKIGPGLNTFSSVPETTDLLQATVGAVLVIVGGLRLPAEPARTSAPRGARGPGGRARRRRLDLPPATRIVRALRLPRRVRRRPLHPLHPDQRRRRLSRPDVHHARDARHRRDDEPLGRGRRRALRERPRLGARGDGGRDDLARADDRPARRARGSSSSARSWRSSSSSGRAGLTGGREFSLPQAAAGGARVRVCVVGCGAVGSLFAANLAQLDDVEVWAYDVSQAHVDAINANGLRLTGRRRRRRAARRPRRTPPRLPRCDFGIVATKAMHTEGAIAATAHAFADGRSRDRAERRRQRGGRRAPRRAGHPRHDVPCREDPRARCRAVGREGRHDARAVRAAARARRGDRSSLADACTRGGMPTAAVDDARPAQWRKVIFNAATNPVGALTGLTHGRVCERPDLRALVSALVDEGKAVAAAQGIVLDADPEELIDHAAKPGRRVRPQGEHAPGRRGSAVDRDRLPERRHRTIRARARRPDAAATTQSPDSSRHWRPHGNSAERRAAATPRERPRRDGRARSRRAHRLRKRVHRLRGRGDVLVRLPDRPSLRVRRRAGGRRAVRRLPDSRPGTSGEHGTCRARAGLPRPPGRADRAGARATRVGGVSASTGSTTS